MDTLFTKCLSVCLFSRLYQQGTWNMGCHTIYRRKNVVDGGPGGSVMVKALRYKSDGPGIDSR